MRNHGPIQDGLNLNLHFNHISGWFAHTQRSENNCFRKPSHKGSHWQTQRRWMSLVGLWELNGPILHVTTFRYWRDKRQLGLRQDRNMKESSACFGLGPVPKSSSIHWGNAELSAVLLAVSPTQETCGREHPPRNDTHGFSAHKHGLVQPRRLTPCSLLWGTLCSEHRDPIGFGINQKSVTLRSTWMLPELILGRSVTLSVDRW